MKTHNKLSFSIIYALFAVFINISLHAQFPLPIPTRPTSFPLSIKQTGNITGTPFVWGRDWEGQANVPPSLIDVVSIEPSGFYTMALKKNGTVVSWGGSDYIRPPIDLINTVQLSAPGYNFGFALKSDGTVVHWGLEGNISLNLTNIVKLASGSNSAHMAALKSNGTVVCWGSNWFGESNVPTGSNNNIVDVSVGCGHTLALKIDGTVIAWGRNDYGQSTVPAGLSNVVQISAGWGHSLALKADGTVVAWGSGWSGECNVPQNLSSVVQLAAGSSCSAALKNDGTIVVWGNNQYGQLNPPQKLKNVFQLVAGGETFAALAILPPEISSSAGTSLSLAQGKPFQFQLTATGGTQPHNWQVSSGNLPLGMALSSNGLVSGIPTGGGISNFTIRVTAAAGMNATQAFSIRVIPNATFGGGYNFAHFAGRMFGFLGSGDSSSTSTGSGADSGGFTGSSDGSSSFTGSADLANWKPAVRAPSGVAVDASGNIYVSDSANNQIRKITTTGQIQNLAGVFTGSGGQDGTKWNARFANPQGMVCDSAGNIYVADQDNHAIRKITANGTVTTFAGSYVAGNSSVTGSATGFSGSADGAGKTNARFNKPSDVAVDAAGNIYVADSGNHAIRKISTNGTVSTLAGTMGAAGDTNASGTSARFRTPQGIAVDANGSVYVADTGNQQIRRITANGTVSTFAGAAFTGSASPLGGRASFTGSAHAAFIDSENLPASVDGNSTTARFSYPTDITIDSAGNLYVTDSGTEKIRRITANGTVTTLGGSPDGFFYNPLAVAVGANGTLYVADAGNNRIARGLPGTLAIQAPVITSQPTSIQNVYGNTTATFSISAVGGNLTYQWYRNGVAIPGATSAILSVKASSETEGSYTVAVSNSLAREFSDPVNLSMRVAMAVVEAGNLEGTNVAKCLIGKYEVTWGVWQEVRSWAINNGYADLAAGAGSGATHPVRQVNWYDVVKWCNALSEKEGLIPVYSFNGTIYRTGQFVPIQNPNANGYRLPSEVEWEWAAGGGLDSEGYNYSGSNNLNDVGWYWNNSNGAAAILADGRGTWPVGLKAPNELGIFDMSGNVWEWCWDLYDTQHNFRPIRGGAWSNHAIDSSIESRDEGITPEELSDDMGFRVARNAPNTKPTITSPSTGNGTIGIVFSYQIVASGNSSIYTATGLPTGVSLNATTGLISGTPTAAGNFSVKLGAKNSFGTGNATLALAIARATTVTSNATATGTLGMPFSYQIMASNPPLISYKVTGTLPAGTTWNATTGLIAGTPTTSGNFLISVTANNTFGSSDVKAVALQIASAPLPAIASFGTVGNVVFQAYNTRPAPVLSVTANNTGNNPLTYQWFKDGVAVAGATGTTYNPGTASTATAGYYYVVLKNAANQTLTSPKLAFNLLPAATFAISGPVNQSFTAGANATFSVSNLVGLPPGNATVAYQWYRNGVAISGATSSSYTMPGGMSASTAGSYAVDVTTSLNGTSIGTVRSASWAFTPQDTGILVYTLGGTALRTIGANETTGTLTGYVVVDRANNNAAIIQTYGTGFGRRNSLEMRSDIDVASTGPVLGSRTVLAGSLNNGDTPVDHDMVWVTGKDAEVIVAATTTSPILPQVRLFAPTSMTGFMGILMRNPAPVEIEHYGVTLSLNTALTAAAYRNGQNLTQAIAAARAAATAAGFLNAETNP
jgi:formylglycine-generating enzyme required for sulfatase activity/sugar lactone lactonase YvrE